MLPEEEAICRRLDEASRRRFTWLTGARSHLANVLAELCCWGMVEVPNLERQVLLTEEAVLDLCPTERSRNRLQTAYAVHDAEMAHPPGAGGDAPLHCRVCRQEGLWSLEDALAGLYGVPFAS